MFIRMCSLSVTILLVLVSALWPQDQQNKVDVQEIVRKVDELYRSKSSYSEVEMLVATPHWQRTLEMKVWTEGMDRTFIRILAPRKEEGVATLRIGDEMWNYLPKTNKVIKVPPSMMMGSWMGSDFTNNDLVQEFTLLNDYHYEQVHPENADANLIYIKFVPKEGLPIIWGSIVVAVQRDDYIPLREKYYDEKGNFMRVINFKDIRVFDGRKIPSVMELIPQNKEGHRTVLTYLEAEFNLPVAEDTFSLRNLRSRN